ncbi:CHRD domain-containing protein [Rubritalea spongiae]|uniref:CHRD domain-containing protein n=1 Tax=Rubritalea spongiae TaxID=430797 RepID=A0ABW5E6N4_9BACT
MKSRAPWYSVLLTMAMFVTFSHGAVLQFQAGLTPGAVVPESPADDPSASTASGTAYFTLTTGGANGPKLSYTISLNAGLYFDTTIPRASSTGPDELVRAVHIHFGATGTNSIHALNIYGVPREDDAELTVSLNNLSGIWDDSDENFGADGVREMGDSVALSDAITALQNGELYVQVHTFAYRQGELRGQIIAVPEPSSACFTLFGFSVLLFNRTRKR